MRPCINGATTMPYSLQEDIVFGHKAKFEGIEIWYEKLKKFINEGNTPVKLQELLWGAELEPATLCGFPLIAFSDNEQAVQELVKAAQIAPQIDCETLLVFPDDAQPAGMSKSEAIKKAAGALQVYAEAIKPYKVKIAFEPVGRHPYAPGPNEAMEIINIAGSENLGIAIDTFHCYKSGVNFDDIKAVPAGKLFIVHVSDCENLPPEHLTDKNRVYTGLGTIPLVEMLKILKEKGYKGFLSVEIFREEYWKESPEKIMLDAKKNMDAVMAKI